MTRKRLWEVGATAALLLTVAAIVCGFFWWRERQKRLNRALAAALNESWAASVRDNSTRLDTARLASPTALQAFDLRQGPFQLGGQIGDLLPERGVLGLEVFLAGLLRRRSFHAPVESHGGCAVTFPTGGANQLQRLFCRDHPQLSAPSLKQSCIEQATKAARASNDG